MTSSNPHDWRSPQNDSLWQGVNGINNPCPDGFRLPTITEWDAERTEFSSLDNDGAFSSPLKLPAAGRRVREDGSISNPGVIGYYWASTISSANARVLNTLSFNASLTSGARAYGGSVRCIKEAEAGPPEVTSTTGAVWMDRNLGASRVAMSSTDAEAYGDLYQWGRGTDGHEKSGSGKRSTLSTSDAPGHGDFITPLSSPFDWRSPQNDVLWQGVNGVNNPCPADFRLPTEAEWETERLSWGSNNNSSGAYGSPLKLPLAGYRNSGEGSTYFVGSFGYYWSSSVLGTYARHLFFNSSTARVSSDYRGFGYPVRCIKQVQS